MKFFNCGSNGDFRYARLPSFNSCEEGKDGECAKWLAKRFDTPITDMECADWMGKRYNSAIHHM